MTARKQKILEIKGEEKRRGDPIKFCLKKTIFKIIINTTKNIRSIALVKFIFQK